MCVLSAAGLARYRGFPGNNIGALVKEWPDIARAVLRLPIEVFHIRPFSVVAGLPPLKEGVFLAVVPLVMGIAEDFIKTIQQTAVAHHVVHVWLKIDLGHGDFN
jgi:hypothetical protein